MENLDLLNQSYCISCDHIKKINEEYKKYNDTVFNKQFSCIRNKNKEDYNYNYIYNTHSNDIIGSSYITKKTCYDPSLNETDNKTWDLIFKRVSNDNGNDNGNDFRNTRFNLNTKQKTRSYSR